MGVAGIVLWLSDMRVVISALLFPFSSGCEAAFTALGRKNGRRAVPETVLPNPSPSSRNQFLSHWPELCCMATLREREEVVNWERERPSRAQGEITGSSLGEPLGLLMCD